MRVAAAIAGVACCAAIIPVLAGPAAAPATFDLASDSATATILGRGFGDQISRVAIGDVNGDGRGDMIIGAPRSNGPGKSQPDSGAVYVLFGTGAFSGMKDLAAADQNVVIYGSDPFDVFGRAVASGDVNGDGVDDIIVSAEADGPDNQRQNAGEVYVIFGGVFGKSIGIGKGQHDVTIVGADPADDLGTSIVAADVTGDGIDDIVLGADDADGPGNGRTNVGELYVIRGSAALSGTIDLASGGAVAVVYGVDAGDDFGTAIAAGDINGDGKADLVVGADDASAAGDARRDAGEAYVLSGATLSGTIDLATGAPRKTVYGAEASDNLGSSVAVGDVNGDGRPDVIVAADFADGSGNAREDAGEVYVLYTNSTFSGTIDVASGQQDATIVGASPGDNLGGSIAIGQLAGDGIRDIIITADEGDGPGDSRQNAGEAYIVAGSPGLGGVVDLAGGAHLLKIVGADPGDDLGRSVAVGNVVGDGRADVLITAAKADGEDNARAESGEAYLLNLGGSAADGGTGGASADDGVLAGVPSAGAGPSVGSKGGGLSARWLAAAISVAAVMAIGGGVRGWGAARGDQSARRLRE